MTIPGVSHDHGEGDDVVGNGLQGMVDASPDLGEGKVLQIQFHSLYPVAEGATGILLLGTQRYHDTLFCQRLEVSTDGTQTAACPGRTVQG